MIKYKIYALISPEHLQRTVPDGYNFKTIYQRLVVDLEEILDFGLPIGEYNEFSNVEAAYEWARLNNEKYKLYSHKLVVLPEIDLKWDDKV